MRVRNCKSAAKENFFSVVQDDLLFSSNPEIWFAIAETRRRIEKALDRLTKNEGRVISLRFGMRGEIPHSHRETATEMGLSQVSVRKIEKAAIKKLQSIQKRLVFRYGQPL